MNVKTSHLDFLESRITIEIPIEDGESTVCFFSVSETFRDIGEDETGTIFRGERVVDASSELFRLVRRAESGYDHRRGRVGLKNAFSCDF